MNVIKRRLATAADCSIAAREIFRAGVGDGTAAVQAEAAEDIQI
jgi:hypothetical protein